MLSNKGLRELTGFARLTALKAGGIILDKSHRQTRVVLKGRVDLVTDADLASEEFIVRSIKKKYPSHSILAEEGDELKNNPDFKWIIDPLDGTTNYAHNFPFYCVSIGLEYKGKIVAGAVFDPERNEMFYASKGNGAFLNGKIISVSKENNLEKSLLATGFPYDIGVSREDNLKNFRRFARMAGGVRRAGSAALDLCYLACGRFDGFWELKLHPWDTAAAKIIVEQAGGKVTDFNGGKYSIYDKYILASNRKIHTQMMQVLKI